jgi:hypothetical protein
MSASDRLAFQISLLSMEIVHKLSGLVTSMRPKQFLRWFTGGLLVCLSVILAVQTARAYERSARIRQRLELLSTAQYGKLYLNTLDGVAERIADGSQYAGWPDASRPHVVLFIGDAEASKELADEWARELLQAHMLRDLALTIVLVGQAPVPESLRSAAGGLSTVQWRRADSGLRLFATMGCDGGPVFAGVSIQ